MKQQLLKSLCPRTINKSNVPPQAQRSATRIIATGLAWGCSLAALLIVLLAGFGNWIRSQPQMSVLLLGPSMWPTLNTFDVVRLAPVDSVGRGAVISYRIGDGRLVHRVVGLPTETVTIQDGRIMVRQGADTALLDEPYVQMGFTSGNPVSIVTLGPAEYLVLGDNRMMYRLDVVPIAAIEGAVAQIIFPPWRVACLHGPC